MAVKSGLIRKLTLRAARRPSKMSLRCEPFCRTLSRILTPPSAGNMQKKSLNVSSDFFFEYGGEVGLDSQAHPAGGLSAVQNVSAMRAILSNPVEDSHPSQCGNMQKKSLNVSSDFFFEYGGEGGVRTLDTLTRIHTFQACSFSHSDTSPFCHRQRFTLSTGANVGESDPSVNSLVP